MALPTNALIAGYQFQIQSFNVNADFNEGVGFGTGNCLTASSNSNGAPVTLQPCQALGTASQTWIFIAGDSGSGTIKIYGTKCLDVTNGVDASGTKMQIYDCSANNNPNQEFQTTVVPDTGALNIQWAGSTRCLDLTGGSQTSGTPIQIWTCIAGNTHQMWVDQFAAPSPPSNSVFELFSQLQDPTTRLLVADVSSLDNNSAVVMFPQDFRDAGSKWVYQDGSLKVSGTNICMDVTNGADEDGTLLQVFECFEGNSNQQWQFNTDFSIQWAGHTKCIDMTDGDLVIDKQLQIWTCGSGNTHQKWGIIPTSN